MNIIAGQVELDGDTVTITAKRFRTSFLVCEIRDAELSRRSVPSSLILLLATGQIYNLMFSKGMEDAYHKIKAHADFSADGSLYRRRMIAILCLLVLVPVLGTIIWLLTFLAYR